MVLTFFVTLLVLISSTTLSDGSHREDIKFDFGWRFPLQTAVNCNNTDFPRNLTNVRCVGLSKNGANNPNDCLGACCGDPMCAIWQYSSEDGCWIGQSNDCSQPSSVWVGGGRDVPAPGGPAVKDYDDSSWELIDLPHDAIINGTYDESATESHAYLPFKTTWYRKHFNLPVEWKGQSVWIYFEGVFRASIVYLNGQIIHYQDSGYTSFAVRLDNATNLTFGNGKQNENVVAVFANPGKGFSGWWYEGGGIYRHTHLVSTGAVHIVPDSVYGASQVKGTINDHDPSDHSKGQYAGVQFYPMVELVNENKIQASVTVKFNIISEEGQSIGGTTADKVMIDPGKVVIVNTSTDVIPNVELWSAGRPYIYKLQIEVMTPSGSTLDNVTYSIGARQTYWDADTGFYLNGKHFTWRGFNNHNDFTGVGIAVPDRVDLYRGQMMRAVGANSWRMSHNPPIPVMLDILDNLGVIVWDENRQFGPNPIWIQDQQAMVRRDRNHPSIMAWSFCNEAGCNQGDSDDAAKDFRDVSKKQDPFRPVAANMNGDVGNTLSHTIDVQGFSHQSGSTFDKYHVTFPNKPTIGSECCSCQTQRGEDVPNKTKPVFGSFNADCNQAQTENQLDRKYVAGCMVWTLFDYYGEPSPYGWPMVSSSFGSIDLAGFAKPSAYWYRTWWYYSAKMNMTDGGYDVPINPPSLVDPYATTSQENPADGYIIKIVQSWEPLPNMENRTIQVYTNAPMADLAVNLKSQGIMKLNWQGWAEWKDVPFSPGKITATALDSQQKIKATHTVMTAGAAAKVVASLDVPSKATGTGSSLVLDGQDAGMVSAAIVDAQGNVVPSSSHNVTFSIVSGPGRIIGVGNGDPSCHEPNKVSWRSAYHGLARAIVQVTMDNSSPSLHRKRMMQIDREGGILTHITNPQEDTSTAAVDPIVVQASVQGLGSSSVTIPVSSDMVADGVIAVAKRSR